MKIALVVTGDEQQFVLTPESEAEEKLLDMISEAGDREISFHRGSFFKCAGGWNRFGLAYTNPYGTRMDDDSTIICLRPKKDETERQESTIPPLWNVSPEEIEGAIGDKPERIIRPNRAPSPVEE
jgi:hypothetical protein